MPLILRKINRNNWTQNFPAKADIAADAITRGCLKTTENNMSTFEVASEADVDDGFLAIAANFPDDLETFDLVLMNKAELSELGLRFIDTPGNTPVASLVNAHRDIPDLDYDSLGILAKYIYDCVSNEQVKRRTKIELKEILARAVKNGRLDPSDLKSEKLKRYVA